jgi:hypothetical protein
VLELLAKKSSGGDLSVNLARQHLLNHEWGLARMAVEDALARGRLSEPNQARLLQAEIYYRLGLGANIAET